LPNRFRASPVFLPVESLRKKVQSPQQLICHLRIVRLRRNKHSSCCFPPEEFCFGVSPRKAANSRGPAKLDTSAIMRGKTIYRKIPA
jgi:hypothetical protein